MLRNRKTINLSIFVFDFNVLTQLIPKSNDASVDSNKTYHNKCLIGEFLNCPVCRQSDEKVWELEQSRKCQDWYTRIGVTDAEWFVQCFFLVFYVSGLKIKVCVSFAAGSTPGFCSDNFWVFGSVWKLKTVRISPTRSVSLKWQNVKRLIVICLWCVSINRRTGTIFVDVFQHKTVFMSARYKSDFILVTLGLTFI